MKALLLSMRFLVFASIVLLRMLSHGQTEKGSLDVQEQGFKGIGKEFSLFEKLKGYIRDNDARAEETVREFDRVGSTNIVQFFLDNITWKHEPKVDGFYRVNTKTKNIHIPDYPMVQALLRAKDVPLRQCTDTLKEYKDGTMRARAVEYVAKVIHGENFLREIELLAEKSPGTERWEAMRKRLMDNDALRKHELNPTVIDEAPAGHNAQPPQQSTGASKDKRE